MTNILPVIRKEFIHIRRDPRSLMIIILLPIFQLLLFTYAIDMDVKDVHIGVLDQSRTPASRHLVSKFTGSDYFDRRATLHRRSQIEDCFRRRLIKAALVIPPGRDYAQSIHREAATPVQILIDGSDANTGSIVLNTSQQILAEASLELAGIPAPPLQMTYSIWYNPEQESSHFVVPGLIAVLMMMICALLTSVAIAREKETGTLEQILVAPLKPVQIVVGKVLPYVALASLDALLILLLGRFWFGVPFVGSALLLAALSLVYLLTALSLGILISTVAKTQQVAMMMAALGTLLPSVMLSGFIFPLASMPKILQAISYAVPARHYLVIIRGILLKGNGFDVLWPVVLYLLLLAAFLLIVSVRRFKVRLG
jgi:ABC-2 type transport system permease protein